MADSSFLDRVFHSLLGRVFIAVLQTALFSLAALLAFAARRVVDPLVLKYALLLAIGLAAGYSARRLLKGRTLALELFTSLAAAALSLVILHPLSSGFLGVGPFSWSGRSADWGGLLQFGAAALGALLAVLAFRSRLRIEQLPPAPPVSIEPPAQTAVQVALKEAPAPARAKKTVKKPSATRTGSRSTAKKTAPAKKAATAPKAAKVKKPAGSRAEKPAARAKAEKLDAPTKEARTRRKKTSPEIKLIGEAEHTCPYCLDPVLEHDPRGVKICPICKTRHHADCWGITGACQIPHSH